MTITTIVSPLSDFGSRLRERQRALAERVGLSTEPRNIIAPNLTAPVVYGRALVNGRLVFAHKPANTIVTHMVMVYAGHEIEAFDDVLYSGRVLTRDGAGRVDVTDPASGWIDIFEHLGADAQTADTVLINEVGTDIWTTAHRLRGLAHLYIQAALSTAKFATDDPEAFQAIIKGAKVKDVRPDPDTVGFSDNPTLCLRDYLINTRYGFGVPEVEMSEASFIKAANDCDTQGFTIGGIVDTGLQSFDVIDRILATMGGTLQRVDGLITIKVGIWEAATVTLGKDNLVVGREPTIAPKRRASDLVNGMKGTFTEPARKWQETDIPAVLNPAFVTEDGGITRLGDKRLPMVTDANQAQHLLSIELLRGRRQVTAAAGFKRAALQLRAGDVMELDYTRNGIAWVGKTFVVETLALDFEGTEASVGLDLREINAAVFNAPSFTALPALADITIFDTEYLDVDVDDFAAELRIAGLELFNATELNGNDFIDDDAIFIWRTVSAAASFEFGSEPAGGGSGAAGIDFRDFRVRILDLDETLRREHFTMVERFDYSLEMNQTDGVGTPATDFICEVTLRTFSGDRDSEPERHIASNPELGRDDFAPIDEVSGNVAWNAGSRPKRAIRLIGDATMQTPTNLKQGATLILYVEQDSIGNRTLDFVDTYHWPGKTKPVASTDANAYDIITFLVRGGFVDAVQQGDFGPEP